MTKATFPFANRFPVIMGILNITPDSFYDGGRHNILTDSLKQAEKMLQEGAVILDIGAVSTRPGSAIPDEKEELSRLLPVLSALIKNFSDTYLSVDTFRPEVARQASDMGVSMINDIYGGRYDEGMIRVIADHRMDYVLMHMQGDPEHMQAAPVYGDVVQEVNVFFRERLECFTQSGTICLDPGFGFGKSLEHNFQLLKNLRVFKRPGHPIVVGLSRKSMIWKALQSGPGEALNGTTVLNTIALLNGADILRVHDVRAASEAIRLVSLLNGSRI